MTSFMSTYAPWFFFKISALYKSFTYLLNHLLKTATTTGDIRELSSPRLVQSTSCLVCELSSLLVDQSARCPVRELAIRELAYPRVVQLPWQLLLDWGSGWICAFHVSNAVALGWTLVRSIALFVRQLPEKQPDIIPSTIWSPVPSLLQVCLSPKSPRVCSDQTATNRMVLHSYPGWAVKRYVGTPQ